MPTKLVFNTSVVNVESRRRAKRGWKEGDEIKFEYEQLGHFIVLDGFNSVAFRTGPDNPGIPIGATARLVIEIDDL